MHSKQTSKGFYIAAILVLVGYSTDTSRVDKFSINFVIEPKDEVVLYGSTVVLDCLANFSNNAQYLVVWYKDGHSIKPLSSHLHQLKNGSLEIIDFDESLEGEYVCLVRSGRIARLSRSVTVDGAFIQSTRGRNVTRLTVMEGDNVLLNCGVEGMPIPIVFWTRNFHIIQNSDRLFILPSNDLHIMNASSADRGLYECLGENMVGRVQAAIFKITLTGKDVPRSIRQLGSMVEVEALMGQSAILECLWSYSQAAWYRGDYKLEHFPKIGSSLIINNTMLSDSGGYVCQSLEDPQLSSTINLAVFASPMLLTLSEMPVQIKSGDTFNLTCQFTGHPKPEVRWFKNGKIIKNTSRMVTTFSVIGWGDFVYWAELVIDNSVPHDTGVYQCLIFNNVGVVDATFFVSKIKPAPPQNLMAKPTLDREMELSWDDSPDATDVTGYSIHYWSSQDTREMQLQTNKRKETIIHMLPYTNYTFFVRAHTKYDFSEPSELVSQMTNEEVPVSLPQVTLKSEGASSITVQWNNLTSLQANGVIVAHKVLLRDSGEKYTKFFEVDGPMYNLTITDLKPENRYDILVLSGTKVGFPGMDGLEEKWQSIFLSERDRALYFPENMEVNVVNSTTAEVSWEVMHSSDHVELYGFRIECQSPGKKLLRYLTRESDRNYILSNLEPDNLYEIKVRSVSRVGMGIPAISYFVTPPLPVHAALEGKALNETTIELSILISNESTAWNDIRICYGVFEASDKLSCQLSTKVNTKDSKVLVGNLLPLTEYYFMVQRQNEWLSNVTTCQTRLPSPRNLSIVDIGDDRLNISWNYPDISKKGVSFKVAYAQRGNKDPPDWHHNIIQGPTSFYIMDNYTWVSSIQVFSLIGDVESLGSELLRINAINEKEEHVASQHPISNTVIFVIVGVAIIVIVVFAVLVLRRWHNRGKNSEYSGRDSVSMTRITPFQSNAELNTRTCNGNNSYHYQAVPGDPLPANHRPVSMSGHKTAFSVTQEASVQMQKLNESTV